MDEVSKNRVRLWLRSEQAMGLRSVPVSMPPAPSAAPVDNPGETKSIQAAARPRNAEPGPKLPVKSPAQVPATPAVLLAENVLAAEGLLPIPGDVAFNSPLLSTDEKKQRLAAMNEGEVRGCTRCRLCETRTHTVFGEGDPDAKIFFIGEGPGENEDLTGRPFIGRAGELLTKMIGAMGLKREQVYIANIVKCRPPNNRVPAPDEVATCTPYLTRQLEIIRPQAIVTLGLPAAKYMLQSTETMGRLRGQWHAWRGIKLMPTYHPAYVLRNQTYETRAAVWADLKKVLTELGLPVPQRSLKE